VKVVSFIRKSRWVIALLSINLVFQASARPLTGPEIFKKQCAKCHGKNGEGVKGKFEGPLQGERSRERLTRYIERNMPDDKPGTCTGQNATSVAKYIYDAFYSREARLRSAKPPRIELARLTNRQYLNSVADLLKEFTGKEGAVSEEHGLRANYYNSRHFDKSVVERTDRQVDFDFGNGLPDEKMAGTNGFSMKWRGSIRADETGDYEFILKTPNGARLWVDDNEEPLIDAWVASGTVTEHKAKIRLLGGRVYPLKLDYTKFKEKTAVISLQWLPPRGAQQPIAPRNLSPSDSTPTLVVTTPFPPDDSSLGYERGVSVSKAWDEATTSAAIEVAGYVAKNLDRLSHSKTSDTNRAAKAEAFCADFVTRAFRRPLSDDEKRIFVSSQFKNQIAAKNQKSESEEKARESEVADSVKRVVLLTLKAPQFLYLGLDDAKPDGFVVATRLSYDLWDSLPDQELRKLAGQGALRTREQIAQQARRMLNDPRAHTKTQGFFHHWLQMDRVENLPKDEKLFPGFTPAIIDDLRTSLDIFLEDTMWKTNSDYRNLLLADYLYVNNRLSDFYGLNTNSDNKLSDSAEADKKNDGGGDSIKIDPPSPPARQQSTDEFTRVSFGAGQRCGVLTHPYLLSAFSYQKMTSPIHRGVFLTRNIVGRSLKPPPMAMTFKDADFAANLTMREKISQLTQSSACQSCHSVINPLGFSLEQFDAVGRFRTSEHDRPIDSASDYMTDDGETIRLTGAHDVAQFAIDSEQARNAFIEQMFHHVVKQPLLAYGADTLNRLQKSFVVSDFNMQKLLVEIATTSAAQGVEKSNH
jgi:Protein of unknown function (DUF1592)/Protein of unknown function (DUF1588)/PA14 domain/Cytochrome C oxidase, cbb3-type, subunit III